jgi:invasion protein IalB
MISSQKLRRTTAFSLALALLMGANSALYAQEAAAPAAEAAQPKAPAAPAPNDLNMGTELGPDGKPVAADGPGSNYVAAKFDAWEQRCVKTEDGSDPCQLYQLLKDEQGNSVAEFSMFNLPKGGQAVAGATIIVPLETLLTENVVLAVDGSKPRVYPFTFCSTIGCIARVGFTAPEVEQFKKGAKAVLTIVPVVAPNQKVNVQLSLKGFTAGYEAVSKTNPN